MHGTSGKNSVRDLELIRQVDLGHDESYYNLLHDAFELLKGLPSDQQNKYTIGRHNPFFLDHYQDHFKHKKELYGRLLHLYPEVEIWRVKEAISHSRDYDQALEVYQATQFGIFFTNTKSLAHQYRSLLPAWKECFDQWVERNTQFVQPLTGCGVAQTNHAVSQVINEVVLHPQLYHSDFDAFKSLVLHHQKMLLP